MERDVERAMRIIKAAGPQCVEEMLKLFPVLRHTGGGRRGFEMGAFEARFKIEQQDEWRRWRQETPLIPMQPGWIMKPLPPFAGAIVRFSMGREGSDNRASVYLDCYDRLGYMGSPYWEVYPVDGDVGRCLMHEVDELIRLIQESLNGR